MELRSKAGAPGGPVSRAAKAGCGIEPRPGPLVRACLSAGREEREGTGVSRKTARRWRPGPQLSRWGGCAWFVEIGCFQPSWAIWTRWSVDLSEEFQYLISCVQGMRTSTAWSVCLSVSLSAMNSFQNDPALCTGMEMPVGDVESSFLYLCIFSLEKNAFIKQLRGSGRSGRIKGSVENC